MNCATKVIGQRDGKHIHRCKACGREYLSRYDDPAMLHATCRYKESVARPADQGPGTEFGRLVDECGLSSFGCGGCSNLAAQMNAWGPEGCREYREAIIADIRSRATKVGWWHKSKAAIQLIRAPWFDFIDPIGSMVDEAIRRARECDPPTSSPR